MQITIDQSPQLGRFNIIDEKTYKAYAVDPSTRELRGYTGRDYSANPYGSMFGGIPFPKIPRSEWKERIADGHAKQIYPLYHQRHRKVPIKNQKRTNFCWINSVVGAIQSIRSSHNYPTIALSSASAGAPGKNYQNVGGWTGEAIKYIQKYGLVPESLWPNDAIERSYFAGTREEAKKYNLAQWFEVRPDDFDELMTCLILAYPVPVGLPWWGHSIFYSAPVCEGNSYGVVGDNSWGAEWENEGRTVLMESKADAAEANVITDIFPYAPTTAS